MKALLAGAIAGAIALHASAGEPVAKPQYGTWGVDLTAMDNGVRAGDDFNRYASGAWIARTTIPADK